MKSKVNLLLLLVFSLLAVSCNDDNNNSETQSIDGVSIQLSEGAESVKSIWIYADTGLSSQILVNGRQVALPIVIDGNEVRKDTLLLFDRTLDRMRVVFTCSNDGTSTLRYDITCRFLYKGNTVKMRRFLSNLQIDTQKQFLVDFN